MKKAWPGYRLLAAVGLLAVAGCRGTPDSEKASRPPDSGAKPGGADAAAPLPDASPMSKSDATTGMLGDMVVALPPVNRGLKITPGRGFYDAPTRVTITSDIPGGDIRYTTNGTLPTATSTPYTVPVEITGTTVLRVTVWKDGVQSAYVETHTYIFLDDVLKQSPDGKPPAGWPATWGANLVDYGMDPDVVTDPRYAGTIKNDLKTIPTMALTMKLEDLFDRVTGIYANPTKDTVLWERPGSIEYILPAGKPGYQINAGVRIRGGYSRKIENPKHAFRLFFRREYGDSSLKYPAFGPTGAKEFDKFDLRCAQNYSWSLHGDPRGIFLRDQFSRDTQLDMGQQGERGEFVHLYINGQYWGLYNTDERASADYGVSYWGGKGADWDVIKVDRAKAFSIYATDGDMMAWTRLFNVARLGPFDDALFFKMQGMKPDGTRDMAMENLVDVTNLIDYMLIIFWTGNFDAPVSRFLGPDLKPNNFSALRDRNGSAGFRFMAHDSEHTLLDVNDNRLGPYRAGDVGGLISSNPGWVFWKLVQAPEFKKRLTERVKLHFFGDGALTPAQVLARFNKRKVEIDRAVVGESARWGDALRPAPMMPLTRDDDWIVEVNRVVDTYLPVRTQIVLNQLKAKGWVPGL